MLRNMRWLILAAAVCIGTGLLAACGGQTGPAAAPTAAPAATAPEAAPAASEAMTQTNPNDLGGRKIVVGTDATYPPMELDEGGQIVGIDPSLMTEICKIANCVPEWKSTPWDGIFPALAAGEFDVLMSAISIQPDREANGKAKFTVPYFTAGQVLLVKKSNDKIKGVADLTGHKVGVQTGTTGDTAAMKDGKVPEKDLNRYDTLPLAVQALRSGDVDAVVVDSPTGGSYAATFADELKVAGEPFTSEHYGILVSDKATGVLAAFNNAIKQLKASGKIDEIAKSQMRLRPTAEPGAAGATGAMTGTHAVTGTNALTTTGAATGTGQTTP